MERKPILTRHGEKRALALIFKVSERTIFDALRGRTHSQLALRIRQAALNRGGALTEQTATQPKHTDPAETSN